MTFRTIFLAATASLALAFPAVAHGTLHHPEDVHAHDAYARTNGGIGKTGAIFLMIHNNTEQDDRLIDVRSDIAQKVEIHTHKDDGNGVMQMIHLTEGLPLPAGEAHMLERGGDHIMLMGLTRDLVDGDTFPLTLVFENAGETTIEVTVDNARTPDGGADHDMDHGTMKHGASGG